MRAVLAMHSAPPRNLLLSLWLMVTLPRLPGLELDPIARGRFAVGSTNLEVSAPAGGVPMGDYLNGKATSKQTVYLADILSHPDAAPVLQVDVPADPGTFGAQAGTRIPVVLYVLYPTTDDNPRPDYAFPYQETGDNVFPHMQRAGERPLFADAGRTFPLILYSGGYNTHGLWHLEHLKFLASHGYIVVDVFHGDNRGVSFSANLALRPLEVRAALDHLRQHPDFGPAIDAGRIGASGASAGGATVLTLLGATGPRGKAAQGDEPRIKAGFGLVPFMGGSIGMWPFNVDAWIFGREREGLRDVRRPFLAVYGEKDANVSRAGVEAGVRQMPGPAAAVMLDGETHDLSRNSVSDVNTWEVLFFDAWLRGDAEARQKLERGTSVHGGVNDHRTIPPAVP